MARFRKLPVEIDAVQFHGDNWPEIARFLGQDEDQVEMVSGDEDGPRLRVETREGTMTARPGDWLLRGVEGEYYPCGDTIFQATYEPVEPD